MTRAEPWVHGELPWLSGPLYRVQNEAWSAVDDFLRRWNYSQVELDGEVMTSRFQAHSALHAAFGFPDWCGHNWDAFNDCFGDYVEENDGARIAVVWRPIDVAARAAPATTAEVGWGLLDCKFGHIPTLAPGRAPSVTMEISSLATVRTSTARTDPSDPRICRCRNRAPITDIMSTSSPERRTWVPAELNVWSRTG